MAIDDLLARQDRLQEEARAVRVDLALDDRASRLGEVVLVGSAALGLMVWRDLDLTVVCPHLDLPAVADLGAALASHDRVGEVRFRDDTGTWNTDPATYPDGLYLGLRYRSRAGEDWKVDIWFVDEPDRQPDLAHLRNLPARVTADARRAILEIKSTWSTRPAYGSDVTSYDIYRAVLDGGVRTHAAFDDWLATRGADPAAGVR